MQLFLLDVRKRTEKPTIIWVHDGLWIRKDVDDQILSASEKHVRQLLFLSARCLIVSSRSTACKRHSRRLFLLASLLLILPCYPNAHTALGEVGADGIFLLPNLATDKPLSGNSLATLTELASVPALAGANTALSPWSALKMILLFFLDLIVICRISTCDPCHTAAFAFKASLWSAPSEVRGLRVSLDQSVSALSH